MSTLKDFLEWTREKGATDQSGYSTEDGRMHTIVKISPPNDKQFGLPVYIIDTHLDDQITQIEILNFKRLLQLI